MPGPDGRGGAKFDAVRHRKWRLAVLRAYGDVCHICGHGGARQADHVESRTERPDLEFAVGNGRPAHGCPGNPCKTCSAAAGRAVYCNQLRGMGSVGRARRIIAERIAEHAASGNEKITADPQNWGRDWLAWSLSWDR